jgi:hypothetical protein
MTRSACHDARVAERQDSDRDVLTSLPRSRPVRRSSKRPDRAASPGDDATAAKAAPKPGPRAEKTTAARSPGPRARAAAAAKRAAATTTGDEPPRVAPTRKIPPAGYATPEPRCDERSPSPAADLIGTTLQAATELAQIGISVGRQTLQSMLDRLPKP